MNESLIKIFDGTLNLKREFFDDLIETYDKYIPNKQNTSKSVNVKGNILSRVCEQVDLQSDEHVRRLYYVVDACYKHYQTIIPKESSMFLPEKYTMEGFRMKKYDRDKGLFDLHVDSNDKITSDRFLGVLIYCNDVKSGGETVFNLGNKNLTIQPKCGTIVMFPPFWTYPHAALIPKSSDKYIISTYLRYS